MPSHSFLRRSSSQRTPSRKTSNKKATQKIEWLSSDFRFCGSWGIRTPDPLLVRQTLWTSWAKLPLKMARDCKGNHYFLSSKFFKKFTRRKFPHHSLKLPFATFAHRVRFPLGIQREANIRIFSETTHNNRYFLTNLLRYNQIISYFNSFYNYYYSFQSFFSFKISFIQPDKIDRTCAQCLFRQIIFTSTVQIDKPRESEGFRACS